jgi:small-conductance mechanosensitive channel
MLIINAVLWGIGLLFIFNNFGYDVTAIVAGLGIGGIAIALAAQNILGDLFNYFVIFFDRPFEIGDFITVDDKKGTVEYIGIKTTRLKSITGEQLVFSNSDLTNSRIHNFKRMQRRRILFSLGVIYQTPPDLLEKIPTILKDIVAAQPNITFDRAHFAKFGASSLDYEVVYFVETSEYTTYMDLQQKINMQIFHAFAAEKIEFAYPTQTLFLTRESKED